MDTYDEAVSEKVHQLLTKGSGEELAELRLDREGRWWFEGDAVTHPRVKALFHRSLVQVNLERETAPHSERGEGGKWALSVGRYTYPVTVEDTGLFVEGIALGREGAALSLSNGGEAMLDLSTVTYSGTGGLYCEVDGVKARFKHGAYHELLGECLREEEGMAVLRLGGQERILGELS
jgi:uncharacterized protein